MGYREKGKKSKKGGVRWILVARESVPLRAEAPQWS
jgi:hypothetical protein